MNFEMAVLSIVLLTPLSSYYVPLMLTSISHLVDFVRLTYIIFYLLEWYSYILSETQNYTVKN